MTLWKLAYFERINGFDSVETYGQEYLLHIIFACISLLKWSCHSSDVSNSTLVGLRGQSEEFQWSEQRAKSVQQWKQLTWLPFDLFVLFTVSSSVFNFLHKGVIHSSEILHRLLTNKILGFHHIGLNENFKYASNTRNNLF
jgi:hypothetical protein